jgi:hypothetical protein
MSVGDLIKAGRTAAVRAIEAAVKDLLEQKHLYQSISISFDDALAQASNVPRNAAPEDKQSAGNARAIVSRVIARRWIIAGAREVANSRESADEARLTFDVPPARLFCGSCRRVERYELFRAEDLTYDLYAQPLREQQWNVADQVFGVSLLCQSCKTFPDVVMIRRSAAKNKLTLSGRSPMGEVEIPSAIPTKESGLFRDALIANSSGKTLAGLFYLRAFVEQFARRVLRETRRRTGQDILTEYGQTIPANVRDAMPSLADCYERLSIALHSAREDTELFDVIRGKVVQHFAFRSAAGLSESTPVEVENQPSSA